MKPTSEKEKEKKGLEEGLSVRLSVPWERLQAAAHYLGGKGRRGGPRISPEAPLRGFSTESWGRMGGEQVDGPERQARGAPRCSCPC